MKSLVHLLLSRPPSLELDMPWNTEKVKTELGRRRLPKGLDEVIIHQPHLAFNALLELLESKNASIYQRVNSLVLVRQLELVNSVAGHSDRIFLALRQHLSSSTEAIRKAAAESISTFLFRTTHYRISALEHSEKLELLREVERSYPPILESPFRQLIEEVRKIGEPLDGNLGE
ncbi:MAG: hypothetical protein K0U98_17630 [Deltaproteobacteria bacterium]|nr:hypothetical protein [Deltaproteobacteria bacterium]